MPQGISISEPKFSLQGTSARLSCDLTIQGAAHQLWFESDAAYAGGFVPTCDAFLVAVLPLAMRTGADITVHGPVSSKLIYNLTTYYQALLQTLIGGQPVRITSGNLVTSTWGGSSVLTGFSAGVDSFCTILGHASGRVPPEYEVTHLLFNNVGSHGQTDRDADVFRTRLARLRQIASQTLRLPLIAVNSNLDQVLGMDFQLTHTIRNAAVALLFQKLAGKFLYSSAVHYGDTKVARTNDIAYADAVGVGLLSTETTDCISSGGQHTRFEKTALIAEHGETYTALDVCVDPNIAAGANCSKCWKCMRTQLSLEVAGKLHHYNAVFDHARYRRHRWLHLCDVLGSRDALLAELPPAMAARGFAVPLSARLVSSVVPNALVHRLFEKLSWRDHSADRTSGLGNRPEHAASAPAA